MARRIPNPEPIDPPPPLVRRGNWLLLVLVLMAVLPYLPTLQNDFLPTWDDGVYVLQNYRIHQFNGANVADLFRLHPRFGRMPNAQYTPLVELSFMLEKHVFGLNPGLFHLTNVLLHGLNTLLVLAFLRRLTGDGLLACLAAAFFAVHPLHVESVAWVTERKDMLSGLFYLSALVFYLRHRSDTGRWDYVLALLAGVGSFLSKPLAVTLPAACLLCDYLQMGRVGRKDVARLGPMWALSAVGVGITLYTHFTTNIVKSDEAGAIFENLLIAARGIALYAGKFMWPFGLSAFYPAPEPGQPFGWDYHAAALALVAIVAGVLWLGFRGRQRLLVFGVLFFLVVLSPSSRIVPVGMRFMAADRFFYLPGIGWFLLLAWGACWLIRGRRMMRWGGVGLSGALCLVWATATWQRSQVWADDETLWRDTLAKYPDSSYVLGGMAQALAGRDPEEAGRFADRALAISSRDGQTMLVKAFQTQRTGDYEASLNWLARAEAQGVHPAYVALMVGRTYSLSGDHEKAIQAYARVLALEPRSTEYLGWMAMAWLARGDQDSALECLANMQEIDATLSRQAWLLESNTLLYSTLSPLQRAICLTPSLMRFQYELCQNSQFVLKDHQRALREYRLLLDYYPAVVDVWRSLEERLPARQQPPQVREVRETHVRKLAVAFYNQACLLASFGHSIEALTALREAVRYDSALADNARTDADLAGLRELQEFREIVRPFDGP
jgi:protein O-mannosyl-transferase